MHLCLFEDAQVNRLRPLVETRPAYALRLGLRTIAETARDVFAPTHCIWHTRSHLAGRVREAYGGPVNTLPSGTDVLFLNGRFVSEGGPPTGRIREHTASSSPRTFVQDDTLVAAWCPDAATHLPGDVLDQPALTAETMPEVPTTTLDEAKVVERPWDFLDTLRPALQRDVTARTTVPPSGALPTRDHATVHESVVAVAPDRIHLGTNATVQPGAILNAEDGPIYIDDEAYIAERAVMKGPCYVGPRTQINVGADIEGSAFGHWCKVGGEVHDTIIHSLSNKAHPGFLGHSYLGRWCNLGADTNNSNLKNDYGTVRAYAPAEDAFVSTGRQFAGLFIGDHSKCGINTMFNTGTVVGTCCNLFGGDFPPRYVPPFSWGSPGTGFATYRLDKALEVAETVMGRRERSLTPAGDALLSVLFERTRAERAAHHDSESAS